jgi:hypothetical protein
LNEGGKNPVQKNNTLIKRYIPENIIKAYLGLCSANIHAIIAGTSVIKTKFLRSNMRAKRIRIIRIFLNEYFLFCIIKNK